jgi:hypothetical protein
MWIDSSDAARMCRLSVSYYHRMVKSLGAKPDRYSGPGGGRHRWGVRHVLALMLLGKLVTKFSCDEALATELAKNIAGIHSDEQAEATIAGGRSYVVISGANVVPMLHTFAEVQELDRDVGARLLALGIQMKVLDVRELLNDIRAACGADVERESEFA